MYTVSRIVQPPCHVRYEEEKSLCDYKSFVIWGFYYATVEKDRGFAVGFSFPSNIFDRNSVYKSLHT